MRIALSAFLFIAVFSTGCRSSPQKRLGYTLAIPSDWTPVSVKSVVAPGKVVEAWRLPDGGSAAVFIQIPGPISVEQWLTLTNNQISNQPGWTIDEKDVTDMDGKRAARIVATGWGDGQSMAPTPTGDLPAGAADGTLIRTRQVWLAIVRGDGVLNVQIHYPARDEDRMRESVMNLMRTWRLTSAG